MMSRVKLRQHPVFFTGRMPFLWPKPTVSKHWRETRTTDCRVKLLMLIN